MGSEPATARSAFVAAVLLGLGLAALLMWSRGTEPAPRAPATAVATAVADASLPPPADAAADGASPDAGDRSVDGGGRADVPSYVTEHPESTKRCPAGMVLVEGIYCPFVAHRCAEWIDRERKDRCRRYRQELICEGRPTALRFCVDRYEYPNLPGVRPVVMVDYFQAEQGCAVEGKRLCEAEEWSLACEGPGTWPYPYGLERDASACNIDRAVAEPDLRSFARPQEVSVEVERLDQRVASGSMARCVSPFGVYDMTGNVDEWVHNRRGKVGRPPYETGLKGGYWGPIRARCRPMTTSHNGWFRFYQAGFRCCQDPLDGRPVRRNLPRKVRLPRRQRMKPPPDPPQPSLPAPKP